MAEAKLLFNAGHLHTYVNRLYDACSYAISALLLTEGLSTSKHTCLRALLHKEFIRPANETCPRSPLTPPLRCHSCAACSEHSRMG